LAETVGKFELLNYCIFVIPTAVAVWWKFQAFALNVPGLYLDWSAGCYCYCYRSL